MQDFAVKQSEFEIHIRTKHTTLRAPLYVITQVKMLAKEESVTYSQALLYLINRGLKQYIHKKGTFFCQCCSQPHKNKEMHSINVAAEEFMVCDDCFFTDKYKEFIKKIL